jgi:hypothetical protein
MREETVAGYEITFCDIVQFCQCSRKILQISSLFRIMPDIFFVVNDALKVNVRVC